MNADYLEARGELAGTGSCRRAPAEVTAIRCPHCGAGPGRKCEAQGWGRPLRLVPAHPSRYEAAHVPFLDDPLDLEHLAEEAAR